MTVVKRMTTVINLPDDEAESEKDNRGRVKVRRKKIKVRKQRPVTRPPPPSPPIKVDSADDYYNYDYDSASQSKDGEVNKVLYRFLPLIVQSVSGAVCYYFARVACKLCMQGFSFSFPLTFITPITCGIFCYLCYLEGWTRIRLPDLDIGFWKCSESYEMETFHWQIGCALGLWWLSMLWINNHIWFSKSERLAKVERCVVICTCCFWQKPLPLTLLI